MIKIFIFLVVFLQHYSQQVQAECRTTTFTTKTSTNLPVSTTNLPVSSTSQSVSSTDLSVSSTINLSNLPSAAPINAGAKLGVCNGGFSVYPNTNISICNKDSLGSTRQASEVSLMFLII